METIASEVLISRLADWGVDTIFGIPGDGIGPYTELYVDANGGYTRKQASGSRRRPRTVTCGGSRSRSPRTT